jgi:hypothetical protein
MKKRKIKPWTREDVKQLRALAKDRKSCPAIARTLRRTTGSVAQKALKLGVRFRSINRNKR